MIHKPLSCPIGSYQITATSGWTIDSNGLKTAATAIKSASMIPMNIEVVGSLLYLHGISLDEGLTDTDDYSFNLSGTPQNCGQATTMCSFISKVDRSASWTGTKIVSTFGSDNLEIYTNIDFNDDGSSILMSYFVNGEANFYDGVYVNQFPTYDLEINFLSTRRFLYNAVVNKFCIGWFRWFISV